MRAKLSLLSDVGEGITVPSFISQVGPPGMDTPAVKSPRLASLLVAVNCQASRESPCLCLCSCNTAWLPPAACSLSQTAFPNGGEAIYGPYDGSLGEGGDRYRLRLFYSGGARL